MKLYMIRHGQSTANAGKLHAGWAQVPLTEQGIADARRAGKLLDGIPFDKIYVSDLLRAKQTLEAALPGAEGIETPLLREINVGELAGKNAAECIAMYGESYLTNKAIHDFTPYGGENDTMHLDRLREFTMQAELDGADCIAAFCHEGTIRCMLDLVLGYRHDRKAYPMANGSVSVFQLKNGRWALVSWNNTAE
ncbi:MAG: histidine phosphatase family protein [Oscillospiraceae bacterium]|nr:histidine phosphatase family protein [Oscillospiraceae bacterium]